jgi:histidinol-phosphate aminotransferase
MNTGSFDLDSLVRPNIKTLTPYRCARDDYDSGILLDANENAIGSVPSDPRQLNRYPDPHQVAFREKFAGFRGISSGQVFCGVGSDEAIDLLIRIFCVPGVDEIMITPPTYGMYKVSASINDVGINSVPLTSDYALRVPKMIASIKPQTKLIFLCSPNNPTGNLLQKDDILQVLNAFNGIVVLDEAYIDFSGDEGFSRELSTFPNLVILQTMSKSFGLAGIRMGIALASVEIVNYLVRVKAPYNISKLTSEVALKALNHIEIMQAYVKALNNERKWVAEQLRSIPEVLNINPSDANFLLVEIKNAFEIYKSMADSGVVIRYRGDQIHCENTIRITIGTHKENVEMITMLKEVIA